MTRGRHVYETILVLSISLLASTALAQGTTGQLKGQVVDAGEQGIPGITVELVAARDGMRRVVSTNSSGRFRLEVPPGVYSLTTSGMGYATVEIERVEVHIGAVSEMTIPVHEATVDEIVVYGAPLQLLPKATGEAGIHVSLGEIAQLPVQRNIEAVALLAPGTVPGIAAFGEDRRLVSFSGASVAENIYYIDGLNVTNFRTGLGASSVPFEFYDQIQVTSGGYSAEFGRSTGGVLNTTTRRGSNEFEFGVVTYVQPEFGQGTSPDTRRPDGSYYDLNSHNSSTTTTIDFYVGGPIVRDRLFFFALYEPQETVSRYNWRGTTARFSKVEMDDDFWGSNLTWHINDRHSLSYTAFTDKRKLIDRQYRYDESTHEVGEEIGDATRHRGGDNHVVRYDGLLSNSLSVSALYGRNEHNLTNLSTRDYDCPAVIDISDTSTGL